MVYRYGYRLRPPGIGCQPQGFTHCEKCEYEAKYWGIVEYERKLTREEIEEFELEEI